MDSQSWYLPLSPLVWPCWMVPVYSSFGNLSDKCSQALILSLPLWAWLSKYFLNAGTNANQFFKKNPPEETPNLLRNVKNANPFLPSTRSSNKRCKADLGWEWWNVLIHSHVLTQWETLVINNSTLNSARHQNLTKVLKLIQCSQENFYLQTILYQWLLGAHTLFC